MCVFHSAVFCYDLLHELEGDGFYQNHQTQKVSISWTESPSSLSCPSCLKQG